MPMTLMVIANFVIWPALAASMTGRITMTQACVLNAAGCLLMVVAAVIGGYTPVASAFAALGALNVWAWWKGGDGDDTKRRLKSWASRFRGVRRTAPTHA